MRSLLFVPGDDERKISKGLASAADALTSSTPPVVIEARNVMIATTATSARPEIEARGTIGDMIRALDGNCGRSLPRSTSGL